MEDNPLTPHAPRKAFRPPRTELEEHLVYIEDNFKFFDSSIFERYEGFVDKDTLCVGEPPNWVVCTDKSSEVVGVNAGVGSGLEKDKDKEPLESESGLLTKDRPRKDPPKLTLNMDDMDEDIIFPPTPAHPILPDSFNACSPTSPSSPPAPNITSPMTTFAVIPPPFIPTLPMALTMSNLPPSIVMNNNHNMTIIPDTPVTALLLTSPLPFDTPMSPQHGHFIFPELMDVNDLMTIPLISPRNAILETPIGVIPFQKMSPPPLPLPLSLALSLPLSLSSSLSVPLSLPVLLPLPSSSFPQLQTPISFADNVAPVEVDNFSNQSSPPKHQNIISFPLLLHQCHQGIDFEGTERPPSMDLVPDSVPMSSLNFPELKPGFRNSILHKSKLWEHEILKSQGLESGDLTSLMPPFE